MNILFTTNMVLLSVLWIIIGRQRLLLRYHSRRLEQLKAAALARAKTIKEVEAIFKEVQWSRNTFILLTLDLTKWTYKQFFPKEP